MLAKQRLAGCVCSTHVEDVFRNIESDRVSPLDGHLHHVTVRHRLGVVLTLPLLQEPSDGGYTVCRTAGCASHLGNVG